MWLVKKKDDGEQNNLSAFGQSPERKTWSGGVIKIQLGPSAAVQERGDLVNRSARAVGLVGWRDCSFKSSRRRPLDSKRSSHKADTYTLTEYLNLGALTRERISRNS